MDRPNRAATDAAFESFEDALKRGGARSALQALAEQSSYRFVSIFRSNDGMATSVVHIDRDDPTSIQAAEVPESATYCSFVRSSRAPFRTEDTLLDGRLNDHAAREVVRSYYGVPIITPEGDIIGTLCHYDLVPRDPDQGLNLELVLQAASALATSGQIPEYPKRD